MLIDYHSHYPSRKGETVLQQGVQTLGIHPWDIDVEYIDKQIDKLVEEVMDRQCITVDIMDEKALEKSVSSKENYLIAIGECGIDKLCNVPLDLQEKVFIRQIELSEELGIPLIIHCVKAVDEVIRIRKSMKPQQPWIFHGFRGKPQQMFQLLDNEFYISFGFKRNEDSFKLCPPDRRLQESDDDPRGVNEVCNIK